MVFLQYSTLNIKRGQQDNRLYQSECQLSHVFQQQLAFTQYNFCAIINVKNNFAEVGKWVKKERSPKKYCAICI